MKWTLWFYFVEGEMSSERFCYLQEHTTSVYSFTKYLLSSMQDTEFIVAKEVLALTEFIF